MEEKIISGNFQQAPDVNKSIQSLLQNDDYYEGLASSEKTGSQLKEDHARHLSQVLQWLSNGDLKKSIEVINNELPKLISVEAWNQVQTEVENVQKQSNTPSQSTTAEKPNVVSPQVLIVSSRTLEHFNDLGKKLADEKRFEDSLAVFKLLTFLDPQVAEFWLGQVFALCCLSKYEEALDLLQVPKILQPNNALSFVYAAFCHSHLNQPEKAQEDLNQVEKTINRWEQEKGQLENLVQTMKVKEK